ncbi:hypothetical protein V6N13_142899 [Hibiscus sabdariffa]
MDANSGNDDNGPNGLDTNASDGHEGVHFGWSDELVDEDSYKAHEDSGESGWLGREKLLSDDDDEVNAIGAHFRVVKKKIRNKTVQTSDLEPPLNLSFVVENENEDRNAEAENEANRNIPAESGVNEKEADGNGENEADGADENDTEENEASSVGLSTGEETDYLGSSDVENYETDSTSEDGDFVSSKTSKILFDSSTSEPRFELGMIFENGKQFKDALYAYVVAHRFDFLSNDFNLGNGDNLTLLSDMQKGLLEEVQQCLPHVEHRYCARHMYANWKKDHKGGDLQLLFWNCCKATTQPLFRKHADRIGKLKPKAYVDLMEKDPSHWSKAFFSTRSKCDAIDNNFCEAFNSAIIGARFNSIISMFEDIRHYVMHRLVEHKKKSISWKGELCPRIAKKLEEHKVRSSFCHVIRNGADGYEDLTGITCPHVVSVILYREESLENYVLHLYKKEVYQELYSVVIPTIPSEKYWKDSGMGKIDPPLKRKLPGRSKHKRRKDEGEVKGKTKLRKLGAKISCRCCGLTGHNIRTCPKKQQTNVQNHANQRSPMPTHTGPSSSIPFDPPPSTEPYSSPHSTIPSIGPFSPTHSTIPSAPQPSTGPFSPPHSTIPSTPPMVFMPTPSIQPSLAFDSASPPVTRITTFSPKTKVTANRIPLYRRSREHVTSSTTVMPHVSSQPTATVSVPQEGIPPKLTIWRP